MARSLLCSQPVFVAEGDRSAPEQKSPFAPVSSTQRASDAEISRKASRMASHMFMVQALRVPGRSRVTVTT